MVISPRFLNMMTQLNISLSEKQLEQFDKYYQLLVEWNKVMNLTGITESVSYTHLTLPTNSRV